MGHVMICRRISRFTMPTEKPLQPGCEHDEDAVPMLYQAIFFTTSFGPTETSRAFGSMCREVAPDFAVDLYAEVFCSGKRCQNTRFTYKLNLYLSP